jgi:PKD repeat protein
MKTKIIFMMIMLSIIFNNCSKPADTPKPTPAAPTADFTYSGANIPAPSTVAFSNVSTNATSYVWDFGDGQTSTQKDPTHIFLTAGTFNVKLTATGDGGSISVTKSITIGAAPIADFSYTGANQHAPATVTFTNLSTNASSYAWDFGDNQTSTLANPSHQYTAGGVYTVKLTSTGNGVNSVATKTVNIGAAYTKCIINSVTLTQIPWTKSDGSAWDIGSTPDVYIQIQDNQANVLVDGVSGVVNNVTPATINLLAWSITNGLTCNLTDRFFVQVYDQDFATPDDMGQVPVKFGDYPQHPSTITVSQSGITAVLNVSWQ